MNTLFLITARGGSKGIPRKNIKKLGDKPLIYYSIDLAKKFTSHENICVSTDSAEIRSMVENYGLKVPFLRPKDLATDNSSSYEVILHAINWYEKNGKSYDNLVLLQPTSPFRLERHLNEALELFENKIDMVVSVKKINKNIAATYYKNTQNGFIEKVFESESEKIRRQDAELIYEINGAIYVINVNSLKSSNIGAFKKVKKMEMSEIHSVDIDNPIDWEWCEFILKNKLVEF
jgi:CMP-N,N'-diacetyllegionaminic acid synthase